MDEVKEKSEVSSAVLSDLLDENYCVLFAVNFDTVFVFWKLSSYKKELLQSQEYDDKFLIQLLEGDSKLVMELKSDWRLGKVYIKLPKEDFFCKARIFVFKNGEKELFCESKQIKIPCDNFARTSGSSEYRRK